MIIGFLLHTLFLVATVTYNAQGEPEEEAGYSGGFRASYIITSMSEEILLFEIVHFILDHFRAHKGHGGKHHGVPAIDHYVDGSWLGKSIECVMIQWRQEIAVGLLMIYYWSAIVTEVLQVKFGGYQAVVFACCHDGFMHKLCTCTTAVTTHGKQACRLLVCVCFSFCRQRVPD
jgi:hypothetical protein